MGAVLLAVVGACSRTPSPAPEPASNPTERPADQRPATPSPAGRTANMPSGSIAFTYAAGSAQYVITTRAVVTAPDSAHLPPDSVLTEAVVSLDYTPAVGAGGIATVRGTVDSFAVSRTGTVTNVPQTIRAPVAFEAELRAGQPLVLRPAPAADCTDPAASLALGIVQEVLISAPALLTEWNDTVESTTCRAGLPITTVVQRRHARGEFASDAVRGAGATVRREFDVSLRGGATVRRQAVEVSGTGRGSGTIHFSSATGRLTLVTTTSESEITIRGGDRSQRFVQRVEQTIRLR